MLNMKQLALGAYQTNCYLVWGEDSPSCVVIDPGYEPQTIIHEVKKLGKEIAAILLTHGHFDHVGAVRDLVAITECPVYLCAEDLSMPPQMTAGPLYYTNTYAEGDFVEFSGLSFKVLHTPGHTPGSVCLLCENVLFSGDTDLCFFVNYPITVNVTIGLTIIRSIGISCISKSHFASFAINGTDKSV